MKALVEAFAAQHWCVPRDRLHVQLEPLPGGLESTVALATVNTTCAPPRHGTFVVKALSATSLREADVYEHLWRHVDEPPSPRVLGVDAAGEQRCLYLEMVRSMSEWPWAEAPLAASVCRTLARLHLTPPLPPHAAGWDYEADLAASAEATLALAHAAADGAGTRHWQRLGDLRRVVTALPDVRARLLASGHTFIHGDVHPGNVIIEAGGDNHRVTLIDWGRARMGSPLEDVASWLHSLGCWEPEARRRHDTLLREYALARGIGWPLSAAGRSDYWLASVSNGLSGAIRYHLAVLADPAASEGGRYDSRRALTAWERVVRQVASLLSTSRDRCTTAPGPASRSSTSVRSQ